MLGPRPRACPARVCPRPSEALPLRGVYRRAGGRPGLGGHLPFRGTGRRFSPAKSDRPEKRSLVSAAAEEATRPAPARGTAKPVFGRDSVFGREPLRLPQGPATGSNRGSQGPGARRRLPAGRVLAAAVPGEGTRRRTRPLPAAWPAPRQEGHGAADAAAEGRANRVPARPRARAAPARPGGGTGAAPPPSRSAFAAGAPSPVTSPLSKKAPRRAGGRAGDRAGSSRRRTCPAADMVSPVTVVSAGPARRTGWGERSGAEPNPTQPAPPPTAALPGWYLPLSPQPHGRCSLPGPRGGGCSRPAAAAPRGRPTVAGDPLPPPRACCSPRPWACAGAAPGSCCSSGAGPWVALHLFLLSFIFFKRVYDTSALHRRHLLRASLLQLPWACAVAAPGSILLLPRPPCPHRHLRLTIRRWLCCPGDSLGRPLCRVDVAIGWVTSCRDLIAPEKPVWHFHHLTT